MARATWEELTDGLSPEDLEKLEAFRDAGSPWATSRCG